MKSWKTSKPWLHALLVVLVVVLFFGFAAWQLQHRWQWQRLLEYRGKFAFGFAVTIMIGFFSLILSLILGIASALGRRSDILFFRYLASFYIEAIRGTPLLEIGRASWRGRV